MKKKYLYIYILNSVFFISESFQEEFFLKGHVLRVEDWVLTVNGSQSNLDRVRLGGHGHASEGGSRSRLHLHHI